MSRVWGKTVWLLAYVAFAAAIMFLASHYLETVGRIVAFAVVVLTGFLVRWLRIFPFLSKSNDESMLRLAVWGFAFGAAVGAAEVGATYHRSPIVLLLLAIAGGASGLVGGLIIEHKIREFQIRPLI